MLPRQISGSFLNCFLVGSCGRKVGIPKFVLSSAWPEFKRIVSSFTFFEQTLVSVVFPDVKVETLELMQELLMYGKVENPDVTFEAEFQELMHSLQLGWRIDKEVLDCPGLVNESYDTDDGFTVKDDEQKQSHGFHNAVNNKVFENTESFLTSSSNYSSDVCSKTCSSRCSVAVQAWNRVKTENMKAMFRCDKLSDLRKILTSHLKWQKNLGIPTSSFSVGGLSFCAPFLAHFLGVSTYMTKSVLKNFSQGVEVFVRGNEGLLKTIIPSTTTAICWIKCFSESYGQCSPEENVTVLSHWLNKATLFKMYQSETIKPHVSQSQFYFLFKSSFGPNRIDKSLPWVRISKYSSHSVCNTCVALNNHHKQCKTESEIKQTVALKNNHRMKFGLARRKIQEIKQSSLNFPEDHLFLQIDGMDNQKSYLPRYLLKSKDQVQKERIPTKITGCIIYSGWYQAKRKSLFFINHDHYENGSNLIVSIVFLLLEEFVRDHSKLPRKLHLNLGKDSNKLVFSYLVT